MQPPRTNSRLSIANHVLSWRDRLLQDPKFQRWAARFPLTRPIASRQAKAAFDLCAGFVYSQALLACIKLDVIGAVRARPLPRSALEARISLPPDRANLLVSAALALGLLAERRDGQIGLGMLGAAIVADPAIAAMIEHHADFYADLADPVSLLAKSPTETRLSRFWPYARGENPPAGDIDPTTPYSALMTASQTMLADDILDAYDFSGHKRVLDVGGGEGVFLTALLRRNLSVQGHLFDLPPVAARASARLQSAGFGDRAATTGGDFFRDPLPGQPDVVTLVRIAHDHDDDRLAALLTNIRRGLTPRGLLVIAEPMSATRDAERVTDVYFAFYLLAMGSGRPRTPAALERLLAAAGFGHFHRVETARPMLVSLLIAQCV